VRWLKPNKKLILALVVGM